VTRGLDLTLADGLEVEGRVGEALNTKVRHLNSDR
jgi:hypothetical protein